MSLQSNQQLSQKFFIQINRIKPIKVTQHHPLHNLRGQSTNKQVLAPNHFHQLINQIQIANNELIKLTNKNKNFYQ